MLFEFLHFLGVDDQLLEGEQRRHFLLVHFVFHDVLEHDQLVEGVSEPNAVDHLSGSSLDAFGTFVDSEGVDLRLLDGALHVREHHPELVLIVHLQLFQILLPLNPHPNETLNPYTSFINFNLYHVFFFLEMCHSRLHNSFVFHELLSNIIFFALELIQKVLLPDYGIKFLWIRVVSSACPTANH